MSRIMGKRVVCLTAVLVAVGCAMAARHAYAETMAIQDWSGSIEYETGGDVVLGYDFTVGTAPITVTKLGFFDYDANGLSESHNVGIWEVGNSIALDTATVTTSSPLEGPTIDSAGQFRYEELSAVLQLNANTTYRIAAYYATSADKYARAISGQPASETTADEITYVKGYFRWTTGGLVYPTDASGRATGYFGPNFQFVPEPGTLGLLFSVGVVAFVVLVQRRRSR